MDGYTEAQQDLHNTVNDFTTRLEIAEKTVKDSAKESKEFNADTISRIEAQNAELSEIKLNSDSKLTKLGSRVQDLENLNAKNYDADIARLDKTDSDLKKNIENLRSDVNANKNDIEKKVEGIQLELKDSDSVLHTRITDLTLNTNNKF